VPFSLIVNANSAFLLGASSDGYDVKSGIIYGGSVCIREDSENPQGLPLEAEAGFNARAQNTTIIHQTETNIYVNLRFNFGGNR
jgi:hypothetical protein